MGNSSLLQLFEETTFLSIKMLKMVEIARVHSETLSYKNLWSFNR